MMFLYDETISLCRGSKVQSFAQESLLEVGFCKFRLEIKIRTKKIKKNIERG